MLGIFGANGFMGRHAVRWLATRGMRVRAVSRRFDARFLDRCPGPVELVEADIRDRRATAAALRGIDAVVQLVSAASPAAENRRAVLDIRENVIPHVALMQAAVDAGVRRYVFVSSGGTIYGPGSPTPTPEHAPTHPVCSYGLTKLTIENYLRMHGAVAGLETVVLRVANTFGPGQACRRGQGLIPAVLDRVAQGLPVRIIGDGGTVRDYVFVEDVAEALESALERPQAVGGTFNVGSGRGHSVNDVVASLERILGARIAREHLPARRTDVDVSILDITAAELRLGWRPRTSFGDGLRRTVDWWRATTGHTPVRRAA